jgi:hypothetical protein
MSTTQCPVLALPRSAAFRHQQQASEVANILQALANERRLMILCRLVEWGEANVPAVTKCPVRIKSSR